MNEAFHYANNRSDSILEARLFETHKISFNFYVNYSSLRYYPSNNIRRDDVIEIEDVNMEWFNSFLQNQTVFDNRRGAPGSHAVFCCGTTICGGTTIAILRFNFNP
mgnify:CR=1 FL=1